jgi:hypothetical protein
VLPHVQVCLRHVRVNCGSSTHRERHSGLPQRSRYQVPLCTLLIEYTHERHVSRIGLKRGLAETRAPVAHQVKRGNEKFPTHPYVRLI